MTQTYYSHGGIEIYNGDCLQLLRAGVIPGPFHAVVTDPPYASGARTDAGKQTGGGWKGTGSRFNKNPIENDQMTTTGFVWFMRELCLECVPLLEIGGAFVSFIDWRQWPNLVGAVESCNLRVSGMLVWDKISAGLGNGFRSQHELALVSSRGTLEVYNRSKGNVIQHKRDDNSLHPTMKPLKLMSEILEVVAPVGGRVLDPCCGAGATLRAAADLGIGAVGIDVSERHCETAAERVRQGVLFS